MIYLYFYRLRNKKRKQFFASRSSSANAENRRTVRMDAIDHSITIEGLSGPATDQVSASNSATDDDGQNDQLTLVKSERQANGSGNFNYSRFN